MAISELLALIFGAIAGVCLASIQLKRIVKDDLPWFGLKVFIAANKIKIDAFDKLMIKIATVSFLLFIIFILIHFS